MIALTGRKKYTVLKYCSISLVANDLFGTGRYLSYYITIQDRLCLVLLYMLLLCMIKKIDCVFPDLYTIMATGPKGRSQTDPL